MNTHVTGALLRVEMAASAIDKISGSAHSLEMTRSFGITPAIYRLLGIVELTPVILFIIPRTGVLGLLLLSSYLGGAIATTCSMGRTLFSSQL